jgi:hypothetical protein
MRDADQAVLAHEAGDALSPNMNPKTQPQFRE